MSLDFSRKAKHVVKKWANPRTKFQRHSKKMSHKQAQSRVRNYCRKQRPKEGPLRAVPKDDRSGKPAISSILASLKF